MVDTKSIDTTMPTNRNLDRDKSGKDVDIKRYSGMIIYLLYLTESRLGIMFRVCMCAQYQSAFKESHLKVVNRVLIYLYGISKYGLWFSKGSDCSLVGYFNFNFANCKLDRKSTSGTFHQFSNSLVS